MTPDSYSDTVRSSPSPLVNNQEGVNCIIATRAHPMQSDLDQPLRRRIKVTLTIEQCIGVRHIQRMHEGVRRFMDKCFKELGLDT